MKTQNAPVVVSVDDRLAGMERDIKKIKRRLLILAIGSYVRLLILLIPLALAAWFLPPFIRKAWSQYGAFLQGAAGGSQGSVFPVDAAQVQEFLKQFQR